MTDQHPAVVRKRFAASGHSQGARKALERWLRTKRGQVFVRTFVTVMSVYAFVMGARFLEAAQRPLPIDWHFNRFNLTASEITINAAPWLFLGSLVILGNLTANMMTGSLTRGSRLWPIFTRAAVASALAGTLLIVVAGYFDYRCDTIDMVSMEAGGRAISQLRALSPYEHALLLTAVNDDFFASHELTPRVAAIADSVKQLLPYDQAQFQQVLRSAILGDARRKAKISTPIDPIVQRDLSPIKLAKAAIPRR